MLMISIMVPRIYGDWLHFQLFAREGDLDGLISLQRHTKEWVIRNYVCAAGGLVVVLLLRFFPALEPPEYLAEVTAIYAMITYAFAVVESLMVEKSSQQIEALLLPVKVRRND
jgi:hypothetical protein